MISIKKNNDTRIYKQPFIYHTYNSCAYCDISFIYEMTRT